MVIPNHHYVGFEFNPDPVIQTEIILEVNGVNYKIIRKLIRNSREERHRSPKSIFAIYENNINITPYIEINMLFSVKFELLITIIKIKNNIEKYII